MSTVYGTSHVKRSRRTNSEVAELDQALIEVAEREQPVTIRGLFYRMVARGLAEKTDHGYQAVQRRCKALRENEQMPWYWIADGSRTVFALTSYDGVEEALEETAKLYRRRLWRDQNHHVEVWCEKDALRGALWPVTSKWDVPLMISRGFSSITFLRSTAADIDLDGKPAVVYQVGDFDPSGLLAWESIQQRLREYVDPDIELTFERLAVTEQQIQQLGLPTRPNKDRRSKKYGHIDDCVEADAIPTPMLREIVENAITQWIDPYALELHREAEKSEREILNRIANGYLHG